MSATHTTEARTTRAEYRHDVLKAARIDLENEKRSVDCIVTNISSSGMRILYTGSDLQLPEFFAVTLINEGKSHPCRLAWRQGEELAVTFVR